MMFDEAEPGEVLQPPAPAPPGLLPAPPPPPPPVPERDEADRLAEIYEMSEPEKAAARVEVPLRSRWALAGKGTVEVRGASPLMVWFVEVAAPEHAQQTVYRHEFLRKAARL
jgi:hypothetical protein